jgi:peroxiredoxin
MVKERVLMKHCYRILILLVLIITYALIDQQIFAMRGIDQELPKADDPSGEHGVPDYNLATLKGTDLRLSSLRGKVVLIEFFMADCPHCREHAPFIADLSKRYRSKGLVVLSFSGNNQYIEEELVQKYAKDFGLDSETIIFSPIELFKTYMAEGEEGSLPVPQAVLFNTNGRLAARFTNWEAADKKKIEETIEKELNQAVKKYK